MQLNFKNIDIDDIPVFSKYWQQTDQTVSDYCFPILWGWSASYGYQIAIEEELNLLWTKQTIPSLYTLAPIGDWNQKDWAQIIADRYGKTIDFSLVPEKLMKIWREQFENSIEIEELRGCWDYLYDIKKLAKLSGNAYMKKRNRVNQFRKAYNYTYEEISSKNAAAVLDFQLYWCEVNQCDGNSGLLNESRGIQRILQNWNRIPNLCGGVIRVGGDIVAYSIGEIVGDMLFVHFEKASLEYISAYQVINKDFLSHMLKKHSNLKIVNREEDLNNPGLREAKMSYLPTDFAKVSHVKIRL